MNDRIWSAPPSLDRRIVTGRDARTRTPRRELARLTTTQRDPLGVLDRQNATRVAELVPMRTERMSESAFAFFRGSAAVMAADLGRDPHSGIMVASCGDAHVANFGFYASPQRTLVFDLNDFDEAAWAPWEWDLKRLVSSLVVAGHATGRDERVVEEAALATVRTYARALRSSTKHPPLHRYYQHLDLASSYEGLDPESQKVLKAAMKDARRRTASRAARKLTTVDGEGRLGFIEQPPTMTHVADELLEQVQKFTDDYVASAQVDIRVLLMQYVVSDLARRVVGVGSVGTRCALVAMQDGDGNGLILQAKEAVRSVLEEYGGVRQPVELRDHVDECGQGGRVVTMQRVLQAVSDPFLGHLRADGTDFYMRQFHDMKGGIDAETLEDVPFQRYGESCATILARAHSQSPNAAVVRGYIGNGRVAGEAILEWSQAYAELSRSDYEAFIAR